MNDLTVSFNNLSAAEVNILVGIYEILRNDPEMLEFAPREYRQIVILRHLVAMLLIDTPNPERPKAEFSPIAFFADTTEALKTIIELLNALEEKYSLLLKPSLFL